jgi:hypothetical protein
VTSVFLYKKIIPCNGGGIILKENRVNILHIPFIPNGFKKVVVTGIAFFLLCNGFFIVCSQDSSTVNALKNHKRDITWEANLQTNESGGAYDYTVFGEAPDANDGPPADSYDTVKPPAPMPPYLRAWFNDNLPTPYDVLWKDYRTYPDTMKIWNLSVQWMPSGAPSSPIVTLSWSTAAINQSEYLLVTLCTDTGTPLQNMRTNGSYSFICPPYVPQTFKIICLVNHPPDIPSNPNPANQSTNISINTDLSWAGGDPDSDPVTYDVFFGVSSSPPKVMSNQSDLTYDPGTMGYSTIYYWKIVAWDNHGASAESPLWHFTTEHAENPPYAPYNPIPSDHAVDVGITTDISWTGGDPDPYDTVTYDVYFGTSSSPPQVVSNQSSTTYDPGTLTYNTVYYWKIVAWDNHGASAVGSIWDFTTENLAPYQPSDPHPFDGQTGVDVNSTLTWTGGDPDGDTVTYDVYFGTSNPPTIVIHNQTATSYNPGTMDFTTTYYWKIAAWDNHGASAVGPLWHFTTMAHLNHPPYVPSNPNPAEGSTNVSVTTDLNWTGGDPDPGDTVTYDVYFGTMSPPTIIIHNQTATSYTPGSLQYHRTYFWRIVAWDDHGASTAGPIWNFTTEKDITPPKVEITTPLRGYIYINYHDVFLLKIRWFMTVVLGKINVTANAYDNESGINRVEFWTNTELRHTDTQAPYTWTWSERGLYQYTLRAVAYDNAGNHNQADILLWKFQLL